MLAQSTRFKASKGYYTKDNPHLRKQILDLEAQEPGLWELALHGKTGNDYLRDKEIKSLKGKIQENQRLEIKNDRENTRRQNEMIKINDKAYKPSRRNTPYGM